MAEKIYIEFHYNYANPGRAISSAFLLLHLLNQKISFTAFPIDESEFPFPEVLIRNPRDDTLSRYQAFDLQNPQGIGNFTRDCENVKNASLEKKTDIDEGKVLHE